MTAVSPPAGPAFPAWARPKYLLFAALGAMYVYVIWKFEHFLVDAKDPEWPHIQPFKWYLLPHGLAAACALLLGPLQFSDRLRARMPQVHRALGYVFVTGALVGAPLGLYIQHILENYGDTRSLTIATLFDAAQWMLATITALVLIRQRKIQQHRQWMTRSFACALTFVEVRLVMGLFGWEKYVEIIVWGCVAAAYPLADLVLLIQDSLAKKRVKA